jgi:HK97 family phage prohead protease
METIRLVKTLSANDVEFKAESDGKYSGFGAIYGNVDKGGDIMMPGCFAECLAKGPSEPLLLFFQHEHRMPIGKLLDPMETNKGLRVKFEFTPGHSLANDVKAGVDHGTIWGMSVGMRVDVKRHTQQTAKGREIHKAELVEVSLTNMPMNPKARVSLTHAKSILDACTKMSEFEDFLRDEGGFSHEAAKATIARFKALVLRDEEPEKKSISFDQLKDMVAKYAVVKE